MKESQQGATPFVQTYFHGTKADLYPGDLIAPGFASNYGENRSAKYVFFTSTLDAAIWGAELALGGGTQRIYAVEPTGEYENDPDLTDQRFPGNPTCSFRSTAALRVIAEVIGWKGHVPEQLAAMKKGLAALKEKNVRSINDE